MSRSLLQLFDHFKSVFDFQAAFAVIMISAILAFGLFVARQSGKASHTTYNS